MHRDHKRYPSQAAWIALLVIIAILEILWVAWFLIVPLQNVTNLGKPIQRGVLLMSAIPKVVPGTSFQQSLMGRAILELSHLENLTQRVPILLTAGLIAAAAIGLGDLMVGQLKLRDRLRLDERIALDYGVGTALLGVATLIIGRVGCLDSVLIRISLGLIAIIGLIAARPRFRRASAGIPGHVFGESTTRDGVPTDNPRPPRLAFHVRDRSVRDPDDPRCDAPSYRLRRPRVSSGGPQGVLPGGANQLLTS